MIKFKDFKGNHPVITAVSLIANPDFEKIKECNYQAYYWEPFTGTLEKYIKAKIFHMTSSFEGFGNVLIEAQSYGCVPMLFDSYAAASDIVHHNQNGILIKAFDCNEYAAETKNLMDNPVKTSELALNAYENVLRFSYEETYKKWEKVF